MLSELTAQEKREFVEELTKPSNQTSLKYYKNKIITSHVFGAIMAGVVVALPFILNIPLAFFLPVGLGGLAYYYGSNVSHGILGRRKLIKKCSEGRISYKEYKQMVKSGEFDRIVNEINGKTSTVPVQDKIEKASEEGVTLSREEVEILRKMISKKSPGVVQEDEVETGVVEAQEETTQVNEEETQTTPTIDPADKDDAKDDGRDA